MEIKPSEISNVESIGSLDGEDVKMIRTLGGLYLVVGKPRGKSQQEVLSAASHGAIARYNVEKSYKNFQPNMMKSETGEIEIVTGMTGLLPKKMIENGFDFYAIKKSENVDLVLTKSQVEVLKFKGSLVDNEYVLDKADKVITAELQPVAKAAVKASAIVALEEGKQSVIHANKKYPANKLID